MYRHLIALALTASVVSAQEPNALYFPTKVGDKRVYERRVGDTTLESIETVTKVESKANGFLITVEESSGKAAYEVSPRGIVQVEAGGTRLQNAYEHLKLPAKAGDMWTWPKSGLVDDRFGMLYTVGKEVEIEVPAGKFKAIPVETKITGPQGHIATSTFWYAPNVGLVKEDVKIIKPEQTNVLKSFTPGK